MPDERIHKMKAAHEVLCEFPFDVIPLHKGYANRTLRVDIGEKKITTHPVSDEMKKLWTGGKGFDLWMMFQEIDKDTKWDSPENPICFSSGPLGGTASFPGSGKTLVTAISPITQSVIDCNVGGYFGPYLKFAGFDALMITGKASEDVIVFIDAVNGKVSIEKAPLESIDSHVLAEELTEMYSDNSLDYRNIACVSAGRGSEHSRMGVLNFSFWDWRRGVARIKQAGRGGVGTVLRDKKIKALVIKSRQITPAWKIEESKVAGMTTPKNIHVQDDPSEIAELRAIIERWENDPDYVIEMMQDIQDRFSYISDTAIHQITSMTGKPRAHLYHIATFFTEFSLEPKGETIIQVCTGTACAVKGAAKVLDSFQRVLGIEGGGTTPDNKYSLDAVACLGACSIAPVVKIGEEVFGNVQARDVEKLLKQAGKSGSGNTAGEKTEEGMTAVKLTPEDLGRIAAERAKANGGYKKMLMVCGGTGCTSAGSFDLKASLEDAVSEKGMGDDCLVAATGCNGFCSVGPVVVVQPDGTFYQKVKAKDIEEIVNSLAEGTEVERLLYKDAHSGKTAGRMDDIPFFSKQELIALRNRSFIDPDNIDDYIARGGYGALKKALAGMKPEDIRKEVIASGLRGRGGGGFPAGLKWESASRVAEERGEDVVIACNGLERNIIDTDPHTVIEGMIIGALATGASKGFIFIRKEYPLAMERVRKAIAQCRAYGLLGEKILGSGLDFDIRIHRRTGSFVCGESSALMASMTGRAGEPRSKYKHTVEYGFHDRPTVLNNVETWANIPVIIEKGADWFASIGTGDISIAPLKGSSGSKILSLSGDICNTGLVEVPFGITLREIIEEIGGGIPGGHRFKAVQTGGPSGGVIPESMIDMPFDYDSITEAGSIIGSGSLLVMNDRTCMVDVARNFTGFLMNESCGKCTACREGLFHMHNLLTRLCEGKGKEGDLENLERLCHTVQEASLCQLGGTAPNPVLTTLRHFRDEYQQHVVEKKCTGGTCKSLVTYHIDPDNCTGCTLCARGCPVDAITGEAKKLHTIDENKCIKCGICYETCNFDAVEVI